MSNGSNLGFSNVKVILLLLMTVSACSDSQRFKGVEIDISDELESLIKVDSAGLVRKADLAQLEAQINLKNQSPNQQLIVMKAEWLDDNGRSYGMSTRQYTLQGNEQKIISDQTKSRGASLYRVQITSSGSSKQQSVAQTVSHSTAKIAEGYGMTYSATVKDEKIPALPVFGTANREAFSAKSVVFAQRNEGKWWLEISDGKVEPWQGPGIARYDNKVLQSIHIELEEEPVRGKKIIKEMSYGGGYFQIKSPTIPGTTTSWNSEIAYRLEIEKWEKGPSGNAGCSTPERGVASGKLFISFKGSDEPGRIANSFVSGQFKDTPVVYCAKE